MGDKNKSNPPQQPPLKDNDKRIIEKVERPRPWPAPPPPSPEEKPKR